MHDGCNKGGGGKEVKVGVLGGGGLEEFGRSGRDEVDGETACSASTCHPKELALSFAGSFFILTHVWHSFVPNDNIFFLKDFL